ncbi:MAG: transcription repressor NadR [Sporomusaceae bacterium]|nr:transcription repressor NadR [Sporomusaceae bacterium]
MDARQRRTKLLQKLKEAGGPLTGTWLAKELGVSRQVIVGDFAIMRAAGTEVYATPQGYVLPIMENSKAIRITIPCKHERVGMEEELAIIIDNGGKVLDVIVEHPVYGELTANLMLASRRDLTEFLRKLDGSKAEQLASITGGVHVHTVEVPDYETLARIKDELRIKGILLN